MEKKAKLRGDDAAPPEGTQPPQVSPNTPAGNADGEKVSTGITPPFARDGGVANKPLSIPEIPYCTPQTYEIYRCLSRFSLAENIFQSVISANSGIAIFCFENNAESAIHARSPDS